MFGGDDVGFLGAEVEEGLGVTLLSEELHGIGAMELEGVGACEVVPEPLEFEGCVDISVGPEEGHHLSEEDDAGVFAFGSGAEGGEDVSEERVEQGCVECAIDHETGEGFGGIEGAISAKAG